MRSRDLGRALGLAAVVAMMASGCSDEPAQPDPAGASAAPADRSRGSPGADSAGFRAQLELLSRRPHASDGRGLAWLEADEAGPVQATSGVPRGYRIVYEVGPEGIAAGGSILFELVPFGGWTAPQTDDPAAPGYTTVSLDSGAGRLRAVARPPQMLVIASPRALEPGERVRIHYGAGAAGAIARVAERSARFWIAVDGDGDGARSYLPPLEFSVAAGPAVTFALTLPGTARPGENVTVRVAAVDAKGNPVEDFVGEVALRNLGEESLELPPRVLVQRGDRGHARVSGRAPARGVVRLKAEGPGRLRGWSNPMVVAEDLPRVLWGDVHGHSSYSDGSGSPEEYFRFARDVAGLDVIALTDHDYWGPRRLDQSPENWAEIQEQTRRFHEPGRFVTLLGYEWTSWIHGHRHVLYFEDRGEIFSAIDPSYDTPPLLWAALSGKPALTFAHHSAGGPSRRFATNWDYPPDPILEPVTEIASIHGSSEAADSPAVVAVPVEGNFVRDVLDRGYRLGFIGSGDTHGGHPGSVPTGRPPGGLAAILSEECTREGVSEALRARRVYGTNGPRIVLHVTLGGRAMGSTFSAPARSEELFVRVVSPRNLASIDLIRSGEVVASTRPPGKSVEFSLRQPIEGLRPDEYLYVRVVQKDGGAAWSSPFFVDE